jgi:hypothetical protein
MTTTDKLADSVGGWPFWGDEYICVRYGSQIQGINHSISGGYVIVRANVMDHGAMWQDWEPAGIVERREISAEDAERWCGLALRVGYAPRVLRITDILVDGPRTAARSDR